MLTDYFYVMCLSRKFQCALVLFKGFLFDNLHLQMVTGLDRGSALQITLFDYSFITPQPIRVVGVLFSPMVSRWVGGRPGGGVGGGGRKKFVRAVSQKP